jgi:DNA-binding response OmpR family regulator
MTNDIEEQIMATIAIVEDNPLIAHFVSEALSEEGYAVRVFSDGRSALAGIMANPPDLVLLDLGLPLIPGEEILSHIRRQNGADLPVIIMTASLQQARNLHGATAFLAKPFDLFELLACVAQSIGFPQSQSEQ